MVPCKSTVVATLPTKINFASHRSPKQSLALVYAPISPMFKEVTSSKTEDCEATNVLQYVPPVICIQVSFLIQEMGSSKRWPYCHFSNRMHPIMLHPRKYLSGFFSWGWVIRSHHVFHSVEDCMFHTPFLCPCSPEEGKKKPIWKGDAIKPIFKDPDRCFTFYWHDTLPTAQYVLLAPFWSFPSNSALIFCFCCLFSGFVFLKLQLPSLPLLWSVKR